MSSGRVAAGLSKEQGSDLVTGFRGVLSVVIPSDCAVHGSRIRTPRQCNVQGPSHGMSAVLHGWTTGMLFGSESLDCYPCPCHAYALKEYVYAAERRG
jgi:hypothetical protein